MRHEQTCGRVSEALTNAHILEIFPRHDSRAEREREFIDHREGGRWDAIRRAYMQPEEEGRRERGREGDASFGSDAPPVPTSKRLCSHFNVTLELLNFKRNVDFSTCREKASVHVLSETHLHIRG